MVWALVECVEGGIGGKKQQEPRVGGDLRTEEADGTGAGADEGGHIRAADKIGEASALVIGGVAQQEFAEAEERRFGVLGVHGKRRSQRGGSRAHDEIAAIHIVQDRITAGRPARMASWS